MIIVEERLRELFATLPAITVDSKDYDTIYDFGSQEDLLRFLKSKRLEGGNIYPLVWLQTPIIQTGDESPIFLDLKLVLATLTTTQLSNTERLELTFKPTLFPLLENIKKAFRLSGFCRIMQPENNKETKYYNYEGEEHIGTDIWDAIKFECNLRITDCPLLNINY